MTLTAATASGHTFAGWSGNCTGTGTCVLTMSAARAVSATFSAPAGIEATIGRWDGPFSTNGIIGLHTSQLLNGKVLMWGHGGEPQLWDPSGGGFTQKTNSHLHQSHDLRAVLQRSHVPERREPAGRGRPQRGAG